MLPVNQLDITGEQQTEQLPNDPSYLAQVTNEGVARTDEKSPDPTADLPSNCRRSPASKEPAPPALQSWTRSLCGTVIPETILEQSPPEESRVTESPIDNLNHP